MYLDTATQARPRIASGSTARVYSYTRFSTPEQAQGDSFRRQTEAAQKWAERRGLVLDERLSLHDAGVSAYRGGNAEGDTGLGGFLTACRGGLIPEGSYLLVESLDRISRMTPRRAQRLLDDIVDAGVTIATLNDGQEYDAVRLDSDPTALLIAMMVAWRGHEESKTKAKRVAEAWAEKRRKLRTGEAPKLTGRAPGWLLWAADGWQLKEPHAATVRRIFKLTVAGVGEHKVAAILNSESVPVMGRGRMWHRSTVSKILRNPAVIGTLTPGRITHEGGRKVRVLEEGVPDAYPAVVSREEWVAVRALKDGIAPATRGRGASATVANLFAGLARCPECGAAMTRVYKGSNSRAGQPKLVCTRAKAGAATHGYRSVPLPELEDAFLSGWQALLADVPSGDSGGRLDEEHSALSSLIAATEDRLEELADACERKPSQILASRVRSVEAELKSLRADLRQLEEARELADHGLIHARLRSLCEALEPDTDGPGTLDRARVNAALRTLFAGVTVDYLTGWLRFQWRQGGEAGVIYRFVD